MRPAVAAVTGALLAMLVAAPEQHTTIIQRMLASIAGAHIYVKEGRSYPRRKRTGRRKKGTKGNIKAQYQRRKQRNAQKRTKPG